jgi:hypothetical protein
LARWPPRWLICMLGLWKLEKQFALWAKNLTRQVNCCIVQGRIVIFSYIEIDLLPGGPGT